MARFLFLHVYVIFSVVSMISVKVGILDLLWMRIRIGLVENMRITNEMHKYFL